MLTEEILVQKFTTVVKGRCPNLGQLLQYCHVELASSYSNSYSSFYRGEPQKLLQYFVVYYPNLLLACINSYKDILKDVAKDMGISDVICMNATRIIRDPAANLKQKNPILWLELMWVSVPTKKDN